MLRLVFMGTPDFAVPALESVLAAGHQIVAVYTQPARPAKRGQQEQPSPVQTRAKAQGLALRSPSSLAERREQVAFKILNADVALVVAYGLLLPRVVLEAPRFGCINIHASLLPRWRGAAPVQRAIMAGDAETGVSIMKIDEGLDTGPVFLKEAIPITAGENYGSLHDRLAALGAKAAVRVLAGLEDGTASVSPQESEGVSYAAKIDKSEAHIDWRLSCEAVGRQVRAHEAESGHAPHAAHEAVASARHRTQHLDVSGLEVPDSYDLLLARGDVGAAAARRPPSPNATARMSVSSEKPRSSRAGAPSSGTR